MISIVYSVRKYLIHFVKNFITRMLEKLAVSKKLFVDFLQCYASSMLKTKLLSPDIT